MKPVDQDIFGAPEGNCFAACLASLLELPIEKVPNYIAYDNWFEKFDSFVAEHGYRLFWYKMKDTTKYDEILGFTAKDVYCIVTGTSPRNSEWDHCVVYLNGDMVHDPHPDKQGIKDEKDVTLLISTNPLTNKTK